MLLTAAPGTQQRFIETFDFFFQSVTQQALDRATGVIPDLESYIALRRDTSGQPFLSCLFFLFFSDRLFQDASRPSF